MKTPKTSNSRRRRIVVIATLLAATIVTVGMAIPIVVKPVYAQLDDISGEQIVGEIEIPDSDAIREKVDEITSQSVPRLTEQGTLLFHPRAPPAFAG
jgi:hypothetical protein